MSNILEQLMQQGHEKRLFKAYVERVLEACDSLDDPKQTVVISMGEVPLWGLSGSDEETVWVYSNNLRGGVSPRLVDFLGETPVISVEYLGNPDYWGPRHQVRAIFGSSYAKVARWGGFAAGVWKPPYEIRQFYRANFTKPTTRVGDVKAFVAASPIFVDNFRTPSHYLDSEEKVIYYLDSDAHPLCLADEKTSAVNSIILNTLLDELSTYSKLGVALIKHFGVQEYLEDTTIKGMALVEIGRTSLEEFLVICSELPRDVLNEAMDTLASRFIAEFVKNGSKGSDLLQLGEDPYGEVELGALGCYTVFITGQRDAK